jgi:hypothetical protein
VDAAGLTALLDRAGFQALSLADVDQDGSGGFHWEAVAEA